MTKLNLLADMSIGNKGVRKTRRRGVNSLQLRILDDIEPSALTSEDLAFREAMCMKVKRRAANGNERRRMEHINAGFKVLLQQLDQHGPGLNIIPAATAAKISKALSGQQKGSLTRSVILQITSQMINIIQQDRQHLLVENARLRQSLSQIIQTGRLPEDPPPITKISADDPQSYALTNHAEQALLAMRMELEHERTMRETLENFVREQELNTLRLEAEENLFIRNFPRTRSSDSQQSPSIPHQPHQPLFMSALQATAVTKQSPSAPVPPLSSCPPPPNLPSSYSHTTMTPATIAQRNLELMAAAARIVEGEGVFYSMEQEASERKRCRSEGSDSNLGSDDEYPSERRKPQRGRRSMPQ